MTFIKKENGVIGYECRHATYCEHQDGKNDLLVVKEYIHREDGTSVPNLRFFENYQREFWVTMPGHQNHKDKKEWEEESKCRKYTTTQIQLKDRVGKALGKPGMPGGMRMVARSPFLYGCDIATTALIKNDYKTAWPDCITPNAAVAVLDIEADVVKGTEDILSVSLTFKDKAVLAVNKDFLGSMTDPIGKIMKAYEKYLLSKDYIKSRNISVEIVIAETAGMACVEAIKRAHEWMPDFVTIWNMNYDLPKIVKQLEMEGIDPANVFSDPKVPLPYRFYNYKEGPSQKVTANGKIMPLHPADRWHVASFPASWYVVDAMCLYKRIRIVKGNEPNYSLDGVLSRNLKLGKLNFEEVENLNGLAWHQKMQSDYKAEYLVYNLFDCIGVELLDEKTGDISRAFDVLAGISDYGNFSSNPRRICDDLHFFCREKGLVIATTSDQMEDELDKYVVSMKNWIVTLPSYLVDDNGLALIKDAPHIKSMMRAHVSDLDIEGTYPNVEDICNISKETTMIEVFEIDRVPDSVRRGIGVNLTAGPVNAIEISQRAFNLPTSNELLKAFREKNLKQINDI